MSDETILRKNRPASTLLSIAMACLPCVLLPTGCDASEEIRSLREQIASARADIEEIQTSSSQARAIEAWLSAAHPMQPLIVAITRSVSAPGALKHLQLARVADSPGRVRISLELSDAPASQMEVILNAIHNLGFREQSVTQTDANGAIKFDAVLVRNDSDPAGALPSAGPDLQAPATPPPASPGAGEDGPSLQATLRGLQDYRRALDAQSAETLQFALPWKPYFALTTEAETAEKGISVKLGESEPGVTSSSFKIVDCHPLYPRWSRAIPQVVRGEVVIEDGYAKGMNWLGMMEKTIRTMRICEVSIARSAARGECRFDLVLEVPLLKNSPN